MAEKSKEMEEKQVRKVSEERQIEEEDNRDTQDDDTLNEPNFIWNKSKENGWGKCYCRVLEQDPLFGRDKTIQYPFYANEDGLIL